MQLVLHAPFGSRVNRAWALALAQAVLPAVQLRAAGRGHRGCAALVARPAARVPARGRVPLPSPGNRPRRAGAGAPRCPGLPDAVAVERDDLARRAAGARRAEGAVAAPADAGRRSARGGVSRRGGLSREHSRRSPDSRPSARVNQTIRDCLEEAMDLPQLAGDPRRAFTAARSAVWRATHRSRRRSRTRSSTHARTRFSTMRRSRSGGRRPCRRGGRPIPRRRPRWARSTRAPSSAWPARRGPTRETPTSSTTRSSRPASSRRRKSRVDESWIAWLECARRLCASLARHRAGLARAAVGGRRARCLRSLPAIHGPRHEPGDRRCRASAPPRPGRERPRSSSSFADV